MNEILHLPIAFLAGFALGAFYFISLWITVRQLPTTQWPIRLFMGSYIGRSAIVLLGFYSVMDAQWQRALVCLLGFICARALVTSRLGIKPDWRSLSEE